MKKLFLRVKNYLAEVLAELKKVSWVKRRELFTTTFVIIVFTALLAAFVFFFDFLFSHLLQMVLR